MTTYGNRRTDYEIRSINNHIAPSLLDGSNNQRQSRITRGNHYSGDFYIHHPNTGMLLDSPHYHVVQHHVHQEEYIMKYYTVSAVSSMGLRYFIYVDSDGDLNKGWESTGKEYPSEDNRNYHMTREKLTKLLGGGKVYCTAQGETFFDYEVREWDSTPVPKDAVDELVEQTLLGQVINNLAPEQYELLRRHFKKMSD
ncbi:hypothetical protein [Rhizobium phage RHEph24]|nr:hypothetical protein [Rhizobium phage RHEph24]